jgi:formate C-acetyltransferase
MNILKQEMAEFYPKMNGWDENGNYAWDNFKLSQKIQRRMDEYVEEHPDVPPVLLKTKLHETIAEMFEPVIFPHSPFFYEMGIKHSRSWGTPAECNGGSWMFYKYHDLFREESPESFEVFSKREPLKVETVYNFVDVDHYSLGYTKLLQKGLKGIMNEALDCLNKAKTEAQKDFLKASLGSMNAVIEIAAKFARKAERMLENETDKQARKFLKMIAKTALKVPANPPETFYEGLAAMWFLREVCGSLESIGVSILGHPDRVLIDLYRQDLAAGRISREEAIDLVGRWMLPTDIKFDLENNPWPETSTTLTLGGCDRDGKQVYNEVTKIFLEAHYRYGLTNPKLNCRYNKDFDPEFLNEISRQILDGHNVFALLNDECLIGSNVRTGKELEDCRLYGAGGCQETVIEGVEHSAGAYYYFNLPKVLDLSIHPHQEFDERYRELGIFPFIQDEPEDFEDLYRQVMESVEKFIVQGAEIRAACGKAWPKINPCPFFSASIDKCLERGKDYTEGGAKYNPGGISLVGFGTLIDALYSIKKGCYDEKWLSFEELRRVLQADWKGQEKLRHRFIRLPKYGHGNEEVDRLAGRVANQLSGICAKLTNERGGPFQPSFFVYYSFVNMARETLATPDGRHQGEMYTQGVSPGRLRPANSITESINSLSQIDFLDFPGNAVLDVQLPMGTFNPESLTAISRVFASAKAPTLQCSCVNVATLKDAQENPEKHQDLMVRISGLSARFIALQKEVQDEIISRNLMSA